VRVSDLVTYQALNYEYILSQKMAIGLDGNVVLKNAKKFGVNTPKINFHTFQLSQLEYFMEFINRRWQLKMGLFDVFSSYKKEYSGCTEQIFSQNIPF
jgi:hypothetical protein